MIYTLTLNPSLDYIVELEQVNLGALNRTKSEAKFPGGKGINVSQVLKRFGIENTALGFLGGFTGEYIERYLQKLDIHTSFIQIKEDTRINVKLKSVQETEINAKGPNIDSEYFGILKARIAQFTKDDLLILSGSIPNSMPTNTYEEIVEICVGNGTRFVVDAEGELLKKTLPYKPFLVKPNHHELGQLFQTKITSIEDVIPYGRRLIEMGAQNVIVSLAEQGAVFINKQYVLTASVPKGFVKSSVGSGDSMVAGFIASYKKASDVFNAFRYSVAAGSATAFSIGLCTVEQVENLVSQVNITVKECD